MSTPSDVHRVAGSVILRFTSYSVKMYAAQFINSAQPFKIGIQNIYTSLVYIHTRRSLILVAYMTYTCKTRTRSLYYNALNSRSVICFNSGIKGKINKTGTFRLKRFIIYFIFKYTSSNFLT